MINFKSFNIIRNSKFIGYKAPFDKNNPVMVYEKNGNHYFIDGMVNELKDEFKTQSGVWRVKSRKSSNAEYIDLDDKETKLSTNKKYQFMDYEFRPKYYKDQYYSILNPIDSEDFSLVVYSKSLDDLKSNIRINIKSNS
jgi:hypothetical protein